MPREGVTPLLLIVGLVIHSVDNDSALYYYLMRLARETDTLIGS